MATAGNQLVGEALHLGKPCLVMPEARNYEQFVNAHFLAQTGAGTWEELERLSPAALAGFVTRLEDYAARIERQRLDGLPVTLRTLERFLQPPRPVLAGHPRPLRPVGSLASEPTA